ncbi:MAG TPA: hypothetical protein VNE39_10610 [Planctomycetota bacterium]|nr:hypothetical protein [Planctomycetota bacterium]
MAKLRAESPLELVERLEECVRAYPDTLEERHAGRLRSKELDGESSVWIASFRALWQQWYDDVVPRLSRRDADELARRGLKPPKADYASAHEIVRDKQGGEAILTLLGGRSRVEKLVLEMRRLALRLPSPSAGEAEANAPAESKDSQCRRSRPARARLVIAVALMAVLELVAFYLANRYGEGANFFLRVTSLWQLPVTVFGAGAIFFYWFVGKEGIRALGWPFNSKCQ